MTFSELYGVIPPKKELFKEEEIGISQLRETEEEVVGVREALGESGAAEDIETKTTINPQ